MRLYLRDRERKRFRPIDDYSSFERKRPHAGVSSWTLELNAKAASAGYFEEGSGIIVEDEDGTYSGPLAGLGRKQTVKENTFSIDGFGDDAWVTRRWVEPTFGNEYDIQTGPGETIMKYLVRKTMGTWAPSTRLLPGLVVADDQARGSVITQQFRYDMLNEVLSSGALAAGDLGWEMTQGVEGYASTAIVFDVVVSQDKTATAKFSTGLRNLSEFEYAIKAPTLNQVIVGGAGEGTARVFREGGDVDSIARWGRIEGPLVDRRDSPFLEQIDQTITETLDKNKDQVALSFTAVDTARLRFGKEWGLHDRITVEADGFTFTQIVRETTETWKPGAPKTVSVVVGTPDAVAPSVPRLFAAQRATAQRASQLERRK